MLQELVACMQHVLVVLEAARHLPDNSEAEEDTEEVDDDHLEAEVEQADVGAVDEAEVEQADVYDAASHVGTPARHHRSRSPHSRGGPRPSGP